METYFSVSLNGRFVFRTDVFQNATDNELARVENALLALRHSGENFIITRSDRPASWTSTEVL